MKNIYIVTTLIALTFVLIVGIVIRYTSAADVTATAEITNTAPTVDTLRVSDKAYTADLYTSSGILPAIGADLVVHINGQITDLNGEADIASSTLALVFHRTTSTNTCTADKNDCYRITTCDTDFTTGDDTQISYNCEVPLAYWIDATDAASDYASDTWTSYITVSDLTASQGALSATIEVNSLLALNIPTVIDYSTRSLGEQSSSTTNVETILSQRGNTKADVEVSGTVMNCSVLGSLSIAAQKWSLTDTGFASSTTLTDALVATARNVSLRTDDINELTANLYWNIGIPTTGVKGQCAGANTILIIAQASGAATELYNLSAGAYQSYAIRADGSLYAWGLNSAGQLGLGDNLQRVSPVQVGSSMNWSKIESGFNHALAIKTDGTLWAWGENGNYQLGLGDITQRTVPTQVGSSTNWMKTIGGAYYSLAIKTDGTLWAWGQNNNGQLGVGDVTYRAVPTRVGVETFWLSAAAGAYHSLVIKTDGTLWAWGQNTSGQLGFGNTAGTSSPKQVGTATGWSSVAAGSFHSLAVRIDGTLWAWGYNAYGQLGLGDTTQRNQPTQIGSSTNWSKIIVGTHDSLAIKTDGTLWAWGQNSTGQLGLGDVDDRLVPTQVGAEATWSKIIAGSAFSLAIKTDGTLWAWGYNPYGQLGLGDTNSRNIPTQIPSFSVAILPQRERRARVV